MKRLCFFVAFLLIAGCSSKDQYVGKYHYIYHYNNGTTDDEIIELKPDAECVLTSGGTSRAGKYSVDGSDIESTSPQGIVSKGKIEGTSITMQDGAIFGGNGKMFVAEGPNGQLPTGITQPPPPPPPPAPVIPDEYVGTWVDLSSPHFVFTIQKNCDCTITYDSPMGGGFQKSGQCKVDGEAFEAM